MKTELQPTAARLTPPGRGGVATIRATGAIEKLDESPQIFFRAVNKKKIAQQPIDRLVYGHWRDEDIVLAVRESSVLEIHCHGGEAAVTRILTDLESIGFETMDWQEQLRLNQSEFECEYQQALSKAITQRTSSLLLRQKENWDLAIRTIEKLKVENETEKIKDFISKILSWKKFGKHLIKPWQVVLAGRPNVGKSSLINRLVGYDRAIVHNQPGTTRDSVSAETAFDGWPVTLTDTAGIREASDEIEKEGVQRAKTLLQSADLLLVILDQSIKPSDDDLMILKTLHPNRIVVANKADLSDQWKNELPEEALSVSAENGDGIRKLIDAITKKLVPQTPDLDQFIPFTPRQVTHFEKILSSLEQY